VTEPCMIFSPSCLRAYSAPARGGASGLVQDERYSSRYSERRACSVYFAVHVAASLCAICSSSAGLLYVVPTVLRRSIWRGEDERSAQLHMARVHVRTTIHSWKVSEKCNGATNS
jgi:hypothetical protein